MPKKTFRLLLASQSPRRKRLLEEAQLAHTAISSNSSESFDENLTLAENLSSVATRKVMTVFRKLNNRNLEGFLIFGADTVVVIGKTILGKPKNSREAAQMLRRLSGRTHDVLTAFCLYNPTANKVITRVIKTKVGFRKLSKDDIRWYVGTKEPFDKAGGYGIQELGQHFVNYVDGEFLNVVGLPLNALREELRKHGWHVKSPKKYRSSQRKNDPGRKASR